MLSTFHVHIGHFYVFFEKKCLFRLRLYVFIFRERGSEGERNIDVRETFISCFKPTTHACALTRNGTSNLSL